MIIQFVIFSFLVSFKNVYAQSTQNINVCKFSIVLYKYNVGVYLMEMQSDLRVFQPPVKKDTIWELITFLNNKFIN